MSGRLAVLLSLSLCAAGCPAEPADPTRSEGPSPEPRSPGPEPRAPTPEPRAPTPEPRAPTPGGEEDPAAPERPARASDSPTAPNEGVLRVDTVARGTVLRPRRGVTIGLVELQRRPEAVAWLSVGLGPYAFRALLRRGDRLPVLAGALTIRDLNEDGVTVAWRAEPTGEAAPTPVERADPLRLEAMGLYRLPGGRVVGVGNVRRVSAPGEEPVTGVALTVYPSGYDRDPTQGYDLHSHARAGETLEGDVARLRVERLVPSAPDERGRVALRLR